jgi:hypothetical protein
MIIGGLMGDAFDLLMALAGGLDLALSNIGDARRQHPRIILPSALPATWAAFYFEWPSELHLGT